MTATIELPNVNVVRTQPSCPLVLHASVDRLRRWPQSGTPEQQPEAIREGLFVVGCLKLTVQM
jgi:hypothetical protein